METSRGLRYLISQGLYPSRCRNAMLMRRLGYERGSAGGEGGRKWKINK